MTDNVKVIGDNDSPKSTLLRALNMLEDEWKDSEAVVVISISYDDYGEPHWSFKASSNVNTPLLGWIATRIMVDQANAADFEIELED